MKETEHVSAENLFRDEIERGTPLGQQCARAKASRRAVSDDVANAVLRRWFWSRKSTRGFALSGFPENRAQAVVLDEWLESRDEALTGCIWFELSRDDALAEASERLVCPACRCTHYPNREVLLVPGHCDHCRTALVADGTNARDEVSTWFDHKARGSRSVASHYHDRGMLVSMDASGPVDSTLVEFASSVRSLAVDR
ncbi:MAG: nucleoside monophosphate kinase [Opitutaceae bacterium]|nr:nucleoside monophosphate kinase [Opitutaceae bacterium]